MKLIPLIASVAAVSLHAQEPKAVLTFTAEKPEHTALADEARRIWTTEGARMLDALEAVSGLRFDEKTISVVLREGSSVSGAPIPTSILRLNVRYPIRMSLLHELGHRLNAAHGIHPGPDAPQMSWTTGKIAEDAHRVLYLYLYDLWVRLYGRDTAESWLDIEKGWAALGFDFIKTAWEWAMSLGERGRAAALREIIAALKPG